MNRAQTLIAAVALAISATLTGAVEPDEILDNPVLEARARSISAEVRCVVCQNESIDTSNAGIARDLRILIRELLVAGKTDQQIFDFLVARYGDFVLLRPPFKPETYALWLAPFAIIGIGGGSIALMLVRIRRRPRHKSDELSPSEEIALQRLMDHEAEEANT